MTTSDAAAKGGENALRILQRDRNPHLFRPLQLRSVTVRNRIMLSPMCQYSAEDGMPNDWHLVHLGARASGGAGIVCTEMTNTEARGRISPFCLGLWNDDQRDMFRRINAFIESSGAVPAIQLAHAGRKASANPPWEGSGPLRPSDGGWEAVGPSAVPVDENWPAPAALTEEGVREQIALFVAGARRAREAGFKILEVHAAHGYLFHQFLSPISNKRQDRYGGSFEGRIQFLVETVAAARTEWPEELPIFVRISATDWVEGGWTLDESVRLAQILREQGHVDLIDVSTGGLDPRQNMPIHPGYQVPFARAVKERAGIMTGAVGLIQSADMAEAIIANGDADLIILGRAMLADPIWPMRAAAALKAPDQVAWPRQYERGKIY